MTRALGRSIGQSVVLLALVLPLWWAGHFFARASPDQIADPDEVSRPARVSPGGMRGFVLSLAPAIGIQRQIAHSREGDEAFLMGRQSKSGWWYYFPLMFLFKSTPAELALALFIATAAGLQLTRPWRTLTTMDSGLQSLVIAAAVFVPLLLISHLNIGHRYMIPLYPVLVLAACDRLSRRLEMAGPLLAGIAAVLVASQMWSSLAIGPHYLAYVNRLSGGAANGWRLMADSSLDWGQDLPDLRTYLDAHAQDGPAAIKYFGTALPEAYGVTADDIEHLRKAPDQYRWFALSATYLDGLFLHGRDPFKEFRRLEPAAQIGYSILVYDLRQSEARLAFGEALKVIH